MKIYTGYHAKAKFYKERGLFTVSISVGNPKNHKPDFHYNILAPSWNMVKSGYGESEYNDLILSRYSAKQVKENLENFANDKNVVLLCFEKDENDCHRSYVKNWLNKNGIECEEYPIEQPKKEPKVVQHKMF